MEGEIIPEEVGDQKELSSQEQLVAELLTPIIESDDGGYKRKIYNYGNKSFAFKGREELPLYNTLHQSRSVLVGEDPKWVKPEDFAAFKETVRKTQLKEGTEHFSTNKTLRGVIELLIQLGATDKELFTMSTEVATGKYSQQALEMLDELVASNFISDKGEFLDKADDDGEALVVLAYLGDKSAKEILLKKKKVLEDRKVQFSPERAVPVGTEALNIKDLVCVHATKYPPQSTPDKGYIVTTTYDATEGFVPRNTVHTSLNHKVEAHMEGNWEGASYVIISPFESLNKVNGIPQGLNTVDTWWTRNPGESMVFPDATLVYPGGRDVKGIYEIEDGGVKVKSEGVEISDFNEVWKHLEPEGKYAISSFDYDISKAIQDGLHAYGETEEGKNIDMHTLSERLRTYFFTGDLENHNTYLQNLVRDANITGITQFQDQFQYILEEARGVDALLPGVDRLTTLDGLARILADYIESKVASKMNTIAVNEAIKAKGYEVKPGGMWEWGDGDGTITDRTIVLAEQLGTRASTHLASPQGMAGQRALRNIAEAGGDTQSNNFDWKKYNPQVEQDFSRLDPRSLRVFYNSGLLTARAA